MRVVAGIGVATALSGAEATGPHSFAALSVRVSAPIFDAARVGCKKYSVDLLKTAPIHRKIFSTVLLMVRMTRICAHRGDADAGAKVTTIHAGQSFQARRLTVVKQRIFFGKAHKGRRAVLGCRISASTLRKSSC